MVGNVSLLFYTVRLKRVGSSTPFLNILRMFNGAQLDKLPQISGSKVEYVNGSSVLALADVTSADEGVYEHFTTGHHTICSVFVFSK